MVPLFGDMQISLVAYVKHCPHFELSKWSCAAGNAEEKAGVNQYNLLNRMGVIHEEHLKIISELARYSNDVSHHSGEYYICNHASIGLKFFTS